MTIGLSEEEITFLKKLLSAPDADVSFDSGRVGAGLLRLLEDLPRFEAEAHAFSVRIDTIGPNDKIGSLLDEIDAWATGLPDQVRHNGVYLRTIAEFLRVNERSGNDES
jgi:hypothetical protein